MARLVRARLLKGLSFQLPTIEEFANLGNNRDEGFRDGSKRRFSTLGWDYVTEKWERDRFAVEGNDRIASMVAEYLKQNPAVGSRLSDPSAQPIRVLDVGPGVGALTTLFVLRRNAILWRNLDRVKLCLLDSEAEVCRLNKEAEGLKTVPDSVREHLLLDRQTDLERYIKVLRNSECVGCDISDDQAIKRWSPEPFDMVYSGFCHHHMNRRMRARACQVMMELAREGAFIGVVDESLDYRQFLLYHIGHMNDKVSIAPESYFDTVTKHELLFGDELSVKQRQDRGGRSSTRFGGLRTHRDRLRNRTRQRFALR